MRFRRRPIPRHSSPMSTPISPIWRATTSLLRLGAVPRVRSRYGPCAFCLFQLAAALVHSGRAPETIRSLGDLVEPEALKTALTFFWSRNGKRKTGHLHNFALAAIKIAKHWVKLPPDRIAALQAIRRQVDPKSEGMTQRNRARLRQFDDPENLRRLIGLPEAILRALPPSGPLRYADAIRLQSGLAIEILLAAPIRARNLAGLHLARHVIRVRPGGVRHIVIPAEEVKNRTALAFEVSDVLGELMDAYLARGRPVLAGDPNGFLFPARKGGAKTPALTRRANQAYDQTGNRCRSQRSCVPPSGRDAVP